MESGIQSSFIPHDAGTPTVVRRSGSNGMGDLLFIVGIVLLATSCALAAAVFLYQQYLSSTSTSDQQQLERAEASFQPSLIDEITRLDGRMQAASAILADHLAPSALFNALDQATLQTVSFTSLDYEATDPQHVQVHFQGVAQSVNSIALENNLLSQSPVFSDPIFSNIDREADGVHFDLTTLVNPAAINYASLVASAAAQSSAPAASFTGAASTSPSGDSSATSSTSGSSSTEQAPGGN